MSSQNLDEYIQDVSKTRSLTPEEEKQLKRQRRLIKNRESAQMSRQKKKQETENLKNRVNDLTKENQQLRLQMEQTKTRNHELEQQVAYLREIIKQNQIPTPPGDNIFNKNSTAVAGLCMFVILFSFGLFFASPVNPHTPPALTDYATTSGNRMYTGRTLAALPEPPRSSEIAVKRHNNFDDYPPIKRARISELMDEAKWNDETPLAIGSPEKPRSSQLVLSPPRVPEAKPGNASYVYCSEAHQLITATSDSEKLDFGSIVTVLLPAGALNGTVPVHLIDNNPAGALFEVSCRILNITAFPYFPSEDHLANMQHLPGWA